MIAIDEVSQPFFLEWMTFDFVLSNGKTLPEDFYDSNPCNLSPERLRKYKNMAEENEYGPFEVLEVYTGKGLKLRHLSSGNTYDVREVNATYELQPNMVTFTRVGRVEDHYELVGANGFSLNIRITDDFKKYLLQGQNKITPKEALDLYKGDREERKDERREPENRETAGKELQAAIENSDLNGMVDAATIERWIAEEVEKDNNHGIFHVMNMLQDLFSDQSGPEEIQAVMGAMMNLHNLRPHPALGGKSPMEAKKENEEKGTKPSPLLNASAPQKSKEEWKNINDQVFQLMRESDFPRAYEKFEEIFAYLLNNRSIPREVYRLFANAVLSCWGSGEEEQGVHILNQALSLNPNYDFGKEMKEKYERGEYAQLIRFGQSQKINNRQERGPKWMPEDLEKYSTSEILKILSEYGIKTDEEEFRRMAERYRDSGKLTKKLLLPMLESEDRRDEDLPFFASDVLWERLTFDIFSPHLLFSAILDLEDVLDDGRKTTKKNIKNSLNRIEELLSRMNKKDRGKVEKYPYELELLRRELVDMMDFDKEIRDRGAEVGDLVQKKLSIDSLESVFVVKKIRENDEDWKKQADRYLSENKYAVYFCMDVAYTLKDAARFKEAEDYFLKALKMVEAKEKDGAFKPSPWAITLLDDYEYVLEEICHFYKDNLGDSDKWEQYLSYWGKVQERKEGADYTQNKEREEEEMERIKREYLNNRLKDSYIEKYYNWISSLGINFKTDTPTHTPRSFLGKKPGRNDPCPCGAKKEDGKPKKYKHCCGK